MKFSTIAFVATALTAATDPVTAEEKSSLRNLMGKKESKNGMMMGQGMEKTSNMMMESESGSGDESTYNLLVTNLAFQQPLSPFFVLVHSSEAMPLFKYGQMASDELAALAEDGTPGPLVMMYENVEGVCEAKAFMEGAPYFTGETASIPVTLGDGCDYVTIASMAINTNDCFVALNSVRIGGGQEYYLNGLDSGSEENDELCANIPGPACGESPGNGKAPGEGAVHVHRGFHGIGGDLSAAGYDWRNPMARVYVEEA